MHVEWAEGFVRVVDVAIPGISMIESDEGGGGYLWAYRIFSSYIPLAKKRARVMKTTAAVA